MDIEIRHLRLIAAIAEAGTVTKAGEALHLSQSALSHALADIESRLNAPLFHRVGRRMIPTGAGRRLLETAAHVLAAVAHAEDLVRSSGAGVTGTLRLTTECYTCYHWLSPLLRPYRKAHPGVQVQVDPTATLNPIQAILDGRLDLAIVATPVRDRRIVTRRIFDDEVLAIVAPDHRLAGRTSVRPQDLREETLYLYSPREDSHVYQRIIASAGVTPRTVQRVPLTEAIVELVKAGFGVGLLSDWAIAPHLRADTLRAVPFAGGGHRRQWLAASLKETAAARHIVDFIDLLAEHPPTAAAPPVPAPARIRKIGGRVRRAAR